MSALSFSFVDLLVVAIVVVSAIFAAYRGFVQESLSIFAWAAAAFAALYFGPMIVPLLKSVVSGWAAVMLGYASAFLLVVIPLSFVSYRFSENVRRSPVHALDRSLGFAFGVVRGLVVVGIAYLAFSMFVPIPRQPEWITGARLLPLIQSSGEVLLALIPDQHIKEATAATPVPAAKPAPHENTHRVETAQSKKPEKKTYGVKERRALDRLIEATGSGGKQEP